MTLSAWWLKLSNTQYKAECKGAAKMGAITRLVLRSIFAALVIVAISPMALAQDSGWGEWRLPFTPKDLYEQPSAQAAMDFLLAAGQKCGPRSGSAESRPTNPVITCMFSRKTSDSEGCKVAYIRIYAIPSEPASYADYLKELPRKRVGSVGAGCYAQAVGLGELAAQNDKDGSLHNHIVHLGLTGLSEADAVFRLRSEGFLCGAAANSSVTCVQVYASARFCINPMVQLTLQSGSGSSTVTEASTTCAVPKWAIESARLQN